MTAIPDLSNGLCLNYRAGLDPSAWSGDAGPAEHEAAMHACRACPCLAACRTWAATSMPGAGGFSGVIGGLMGRAQLEAERRKHRRLERDAEPPAPRAIGRSGAAPGGAWRRSWRPGHGGAPASGMGEGPGLSPV